MGSTFANVHVRVPSAGDPLAAVRAVVDATVRAAGFQPTDEEDTDRQLILVRAGDWVGVHDQAADSDPDDAHGPLLLALSRELGPAVSVAVYDSDLLVLDLAVGGKRVDHFVSNPGFPEQGRRPAPRPHAKAWAKGLGADADALLPVFAADDVFAEAALEPLGAVLGVPPAALSRGYGYLVAEGLPDGVVRLGYRHAERPAWKDEHTGPPRLLTGLDEMRAAGHTASVLVGALEAAVGAELRASLTTRNHGGAGAGLAVEIAGPPWLEVHRVELRPRTGNPARVLKPSRGVACQISGGPCYEWPW